MQGGRLKPDEKQSAKPRGGLARWRVRRRLGALLLTEAGTEKRAGVWVREGRATELTPRNRSTASAPTPTRVDAAELAAICAAHSMRLHGLLRDQRAIAGIGRRLANEVCHRAKLSPFANASKLATPTRSRAGGGHPRRCIDESLAYERGRDDMSSSKERPGEVHHRTGETCPVCGDAVREVEYTRYTVNYCADLPDRRQGPGRQHHQQVPQVVAIALWSSRRSVPGATRHWGGGELARQLRMLRDHGQNRKYYHEVEGYNGRLRPIQAGILSVKLRHLPDWTAKRREVRAECSGVFRELAARDCGAVRAEMGEGGVASLCGAGSRPGRLHAPSGRGGMGRGFTTRCRCTCRRLTRGRDMRLGISRWRKRRRGRLCRCPCSRG